MYLPKLSNYKSAAGALALAAVLPLALTGCQDEEFGYSKEEIRAAAYDRNFVAKYGEVDPEQSWDLSNYAVPTSVNPATRAVNATLSDGQGQRIGTISTVDEYYYVESKLVAQFNDKLPEGDASNVQQGTTDFHLFSNGTFYIIPMYQGQSGVKSALHMVVKYKNQEYDQLIWSRSEGIQRQTEGNFQWLDLKNTQLSKDDQRDIWQTIDWYRDTSEKNYYSSSRAAKGIRTQPIKCNIPYGAEVHFYLEIVNGHLNYRQSATTDEYDSRVAGHNEANLARSGDKMWSNQGKMIHLTGQGFEVNNIEKYGKEYMFIACEDAWAPSDFNAPTMDYTSDRTVNTSQYSADQGNIRDMPDMYSNDNGKMHVNINPSDWNGDNDMNDLVFLFVADKLPDVVSSTVVKKRYIIEDLGSIVDWDFNDIVVDMEQISDPTTGNAQQKATLKHLCGTTPFDLFVGEVGNESKSVRLNFAGDVTTTDFMGESLNVSIAADHPINGQQMATEAELNLEFYLPRALWNPDENNIWVRVYPTADKYKNYNRNPSAGKEYVNAGNDPYGGNTTSDVNTQNPGEGEINPSFDYDSFIDFAFPRKGQVPRIIAVNTDYQWTAESNDIQKEMWTVYHIQATAKNYVPTETVAGGVVTGTGSYKPGSDIYLTATPDPGFRFDHWEGNGITDAQKYDRLLHVGQANANRDDFKAFFESVSDPRVIWEGNANTEMTYSTLMIQSQYNNVQSWNRLLDALSAGYNTIKVYSKDGSSEGQFGLDLAWEDCIVAGDAKYYNYNQNGVATYVLTPKQIEKLKDSSTTGLLVRIWSGAIEKIEMVHTNQFFTVTLLNEQNGGVYAADRSTDAKFAANGNNVYRQASYAYGTKAILTPRAADGYLFDHWEQYADEAGTQLLNTDLGGENGVLEVESSAILRAIFKEKGKLTFNTAKGEIVTVQYKTANGEYTDVTSGTQLDLSAQDLTFKVTSLKQTESGDVITEKDGGNFDRYKIDWNDGANSTKDVAPSGEVTFHWDPAKGLALNLTVKFMARAVIQRVTGDENEYDVAEAGYALLREKGSDDEAVQNVLYVPNGSSVSMTPYAKDGHKFVNWNVSNNLSIEKEVNGPTLVWARFTRLSADVYWNDDAGVSVNNGSAFNRLAYGNADAFIEELPSSGSQIIRFTFKKIEEKDDEGNVTSTHGVTGDVKLFTAYENAAHDGGWTVLDPSEPNKVYTLNNATQLQITLSEGDIAKIKERAGLLLQNLTQSPFVVTTVELLQ